ncbi:cell wall-binding repeat-containing protein [Catenulispora subtropica]|uniref:Cell wall binding repeat 2-containing protein n=1 Tax=Catenulispora subtropica TaxID=450798 RepID=A0ABP5DX34_9ACTN
MFAAAALAAALGAGRPETAHAAPAYQDGFIVYGSGDAGWTVVNPDGSQSRTIKVGTPDEVIDAVYSPDGRRVAYLLWDHESHEMTVRTEHTDGTPGGTVASTYQIWHLAWTPDGSRVALDGFRTIPADSDGSTITVPTDDCRSNPQITTSGYVFFKHDCDQPAGPLAVFRPGEDVSSIVSPDQAVISADGTRLAQVVGNPGTTESIVVRQVGGHDPGYHVTAVPDSAVLRGFGPGGDIIYTDVDPDGNHRIRTVADFPNATSRTVVTTKATITFVHWANGPSNLSQRPVVDRVAGADRIGTALQASRWAFDGVGQPGRKAATAVLARSDLFPDALTGTALAIQAGGPLMLTPGDALAPDVGAELHRILPTGATVYLLGGTAALSPAVADQVRRLGFTPVRLGGADRYATAVAVATTIAGTHPTSVLVATGTAFPDALTAGVAAGQERYRVPGGGVVLLTDGGSMPAATRAYLDSLTPGGQNTYVVGGPAATAMDSVLPKWPGLTKLVGTDRYATAALVATSALFGQGTQQVFGAGTGARYAAAVIATGLDFPDALSGGALAGSRNGPLLLAGPAGPTAQEIDILRSRHLDEIVVAGGTAVVSPQVLATTADAVFGPRGWDSFTNRAAPPLR